MVAKLLFLTAIIHQTCLVSRWMTAFGSNWKKTIPFVRLYYSTVFLILTVTLFLSKQQICGSCASNGRTMLKFEH